jgi:hypothetical protein
MLAVGDKVYKEGVLAFAAPAVERQEAVRKKRLPQAVGSDPEDTR